MVTVVIAPDGFGGSLTAPEAARAMAEGWRAVRPSDDILCVPMSDGGEGLLEVVAGPGDSWGSLEVADPLGRPVTAALLAREDDSVVIESARACGLKLVPPERREPLLATTYGVGQLLLAARATGTHRILVGLGGSATTDGGAGALTALGFRPRVADGSGLKIGGGELGRVHAIGRDWVDDWSGVEVVLVTDVVTTLPDAAPVFGPQKGADADAVEVLRAGLERWADVVERDLVASTEPRTSGRGGLDAVGADPAGGHVRLRDQPGSGAAGGLGFGLRAGLGANVRSGSEVVGELVGLPRALDAADVVVTGEGRLDATTVAGKVVAHVAGLARSRRLPVHAVVGRMEPGAPELDDVQVASASGPSDRPEDDVRAAAARSASAFRP